MEISGQLHAQVASVPRKESLVPTGKALGELQRRPGQDGEEENPCPCRKSNNGLPAYSQSLYCLKILTSDNF